MRLACGVYGDLPLLALVKGLAHMRWLSEAVDCPIEGHAIFTVKFTGHSAQSGSGSRYPARDTCLLAGDAWRCGSPGGEN